MRKQWRESVNNVMEELVPENPKRTGLWIQNVEDTTFSVYARKDNPYGGIYIYKTGHLYLTRDQDCHKQWWIKTVLAGAKSVRVVEFFAED